MQAESHFGAFSNKNKSVSVANKSLERMTKPRDFIREWGIPSQLRCRVWAYWRDLSRVRHCSNSSRHRHRKKEEGGQFNAWLQGCDVSSLPIDKTCRCFVTNSEQYLIHTLHPGHDTTKLSCLRRVRFGGVNWIYDNSGLSPTVNLKSEYLNTLIAIIVQFTLPRQTRHIRDCFNRPGKGDTNMCRILKKNSQWPHQRATSGGGAKFNIYDCFVVVSSNKTRQLDADQCRLAVRFYRNSRQLPTTTHYAVHTRPDDRNYYYYYYYYYYFDPGTQLPGNEKIMVCNKKKYKNQAGMNLTPYLLLLLLCLITP